MEKYKICPYCETANEKESSNCEVCNNDFEQMLAFVEKNKEKNKSPFFDIYCGECGLQHRFPTKGNFLSFFKECERFQLFFEMSEEKILCGRCARNGIEMKPSKISNLSWEEVEKINKKLHRNHTIPKYYLLKMSKTQNQKLPEIVEKKTERNHPPVPEILKSRFDKIGGSEEYLRNLIFSIGILLSIIFLLKFIFT